MLDPFCPQRKPLRATPITQGIDQCLQDLARRAHQFQALGLEQPLLT
jgi:hypothetical protein